MRFGGKRWKPSLKPYEMQNSYIVVAVCFMRNMIICQVLPLNFLSSLGSFTCEDSRMFLFVWFDFHTFLFLFLLVFSFELLILSVRNLLLSILNLGLRGNKYSSRYGRSFWTAKKFPPLPETKKNFRPNFLQQNLKDFPNGN